MPEFQDITSLALLASVLFMGERWLHKLVAHLMSNNERQYQISQEILKTLSAIQEFLKNQETK